MSLPLRRATLLAVSLVALLFAGLLTASPASALPPTISVTKTAPNTSGWNNTDVSVKLTFNQLVNANAVLSGASTGDHGMEEGKVLDFVIANEGTTTVTWNAMNGLNQESKGDFSVKIDKTAPFIVSSVPSSGKTYLRYTTTLETSVACTDARSGVASCVNTKPGTSLHLTKSGAFTYDFTLTDLAGNTRVASVPYTVIDDPAVDNAPPVISLTGATPNVQGWYTTKPTLTVKATDASSIDVLHVALKDRVIDAPKGDTTIQLPTFSDGNNTVSAQAMDSFVNWAEFSQNVRVDSTPPTAAIQGLANKEQLLQNASRSITPTCVDATSGVMTCTITVDNVPLAAGSALPTSVLGAHTLRVTAVDGAGHATTTPTEYTVTAIPDTNDPQIVSVVPSDVAGTDGWHRGDLSLTVTGTDPGAGASGIRGIQYVYSGFNVIEVAADANGTAVIPLNREGKNLQVSVRALDKTGRWSQWSVFGYSRDLAAPTVTVDGVIAGTDLLPASGAKASFSCADTGSGIATCAATLDGVKFESGSAIDASTGSHTLRVTATDASGLFTVVDTAFSVTAAQTGTTPPPVQVTPTPPGSVVTVPPVKAASTTALKVKGRTATVTVREKSPASAKAAVKLTIKKGSKTVKTLKGTIGAKNRVGIHLPKLAKGTYTVTVTYSGNAAIAGSAKTVKVRIK